MLEIVWFISCLALAWIDIRTKKLPNQMVIWATAATYATAIIFAAIDGTWSALLNASGLALGTASLFLLIALFAKGSFGMGDVKFAPLCFLLVGFEGLPTTLLAVASSFMLAAAVGLAMTVAKKRDLKYKIPFGPFMVAGAVIALLF